MKKLITVSFIAMMIASVSFLASCNKNDNDEPKVTIPADATAIIGDDSGEGFVELSVAAIERATTYKWYKDGSVVQNTASKTYRATASGTYKVAGVNSAGEGKASPDKAVTVTGKPGDEKLPADAPAITGNNSGEESVELSVAAIERATSYKWYKDGVSVQESEQRTYTATESGTYKVAGVNDEGEGKASPDKMVTITGGGSGEPLTIDDLVGEWSVEGIFIGGGNAYPADHTATITKVDDNTIKVTYFLGLDTLFGETGNTDEISFSFNPSTSELTILNHRGTFFTFSGKPENVDIIAPAVEDTYADNVPLDFPLYKVTVKNGKPTIDFQDPNGYVFDVEGQNYMAQCVVLAFPTGQPITKENCLGGYGSFAGTVFTKGGTRSEAISNSNLPKLMVSDIVRNYTTSFSYR